MKKDLNKPIARQEIIANFWSLWQVYVDLLANCNSNFLKIMQEFDVNDFWENLINQNSLINVVIPDPKKTQCFTSYASRKIPTNNYYLKDYIESKDAVLLWDIDEKDIDSYLWKNATWARFPLLLNKIDWWKYKVYKILPQWIEMSIPSWRVSYGAIENAKWNIEENFAN